MKACDVEKFSTWLFCVLEHNGNLTNGAQWEKSNRWYDWVFKIIDALFVTVSGVASRRRIVDVRLPHLPRDHRHRVCHKYSQRYYVDAETLLVQNTWWSLAQAVPIKRECTVCVSSLTSWQDQHSTAWGHMCCNGLTETLTCSEGSALGVVCF